MNGSSKRLMCLLALGALALTACGGDDEAATVVSSADGSATVESDGAADSPESADSQPATSDGTQTSVASGEGAAAGDPNSEYCKAVRGEIEMPADLGDVATMDFSDSEALQEMLDDAEANMSQTVLIAPEDIRADFQVMLESSMSMISELAENGGDFTGLDMSSFESPEFVAASERVDRYNVEVCGYDATSATMPAAVDTDSMTSMLETMLAPLQAQMNLSDEQVTCLSEKMAASMSESGVPDMTAAMTYFTDCGIDPAAGG